MPSDRIPLVSESIAKVGEQTWLFDRAIHVIDSVHSDGDLTPIRLIFEVPSDRGLGEFDPGNSIIRVNPRGAYIDLATVHEIGHFLDLCGMGSGTNYATYDSISMARWNHAAHNTSTVKHLEKLRKLKNKKWQIKRLDGSEEAVSIDIDYIEYLLDDAELWARSYAQYIAVTSCNETLLEQIEARRSLLRWQIYPDQWQDDDFAPVAAEIDLLFDNLGWRPLP